MGLSMSSSSSNNSNNHNIPPPYPRALPVAGVWRRVLEEDPLGGDADTTTLVLWQQAARSGLYVDLRLPAGSPGRSDDDAKTTAPASNHQDFPARPAALAGRANPNPMSAALLQKYLPLVAKQKSFAGWLNYQPGDTTASGLALKEDAVLREHVDKAAADNNNAIALCTCHWHRHLDYQPPTGGQDIGVCAAQPTTEDPLILRETGDDASYAEDWSRAKAIPKDGPFMALELISEHEEEETNGSTRTISRKGYWVRAGNQFAYAVGRPTAANANSNDNNAAAKIHDCVGQDLLQAIQTVLPLKGNENDAQLLQQQWDAMMSYVCVTGSVQDNDTWTIQHSLNPELVGCQLVAATLGGQQCCSQLFKTANDLVEQVISLGASSVVKRVWKVHELTGCSLPT